MGLLLKKSRLERLSSLCENEVLWTLCVRPMELVDIVCIERFFATSSEAFFEWLG